MTPAEHYAKAEELLEQVSKQIRPGTPVAEIQAIAAVAQAHAALAAVPAPAAPPGPPLLLGRTMEQWRDAAPLMTREQRLSDADVIEHWLRMEDPNGWPRLIPTAAVQLAHQVVAILRAMP